MQDPAGWRDRIVLRRNAMIGSARFQRIMLRFPLLAGFARRRASAMFDFINGYVHAQSIAAGVELGLFDLLRDGPRELADLAERFAMPPESVDRLMKALAAIGFVERLGKGNWTLGQQGAAFVATPGLNEMVRHHRHFYADLADPVALLRRGGGGGALAAYWNYRSDRPADAQEYSALMAASQPMVAAQIIDAYDFSRHRKLLDIGGGLARFAEAVAWAAPALDVAMFDLPAVADAAQERIDAAGLGTRITVHRGSFIDDPLPGGADVITLVRVLHDHDDSVAAALLRSIHSRLSPGDSLVIAEPMAGVRGFESMGDGYFGWYLLAMGSGRPRTAAEIAAMLTDAGFRAIRKVPTALPLTVSMIVATR